MKVALIVEYEATEAEADSIEKAIRTLLVSMHILNVTVERRSTMKP